MKTSFALMFLAVSIASPLIASAAPIKLKPGLWEVSVKTKMNGKEMNVQDELAKAMAKMTPEQKKMVAAQMEKIGGVSERGIQICYTKELLDRGDVLGKDSKGACDTSIKSQTATHVVMDFNCKDGSAGDGEWNLKGDTSYTGIIKLKQKDGKPVEINQKGSFLKADCGKVQPL